LLQQKIKAIDSAALWCDRIPEMINAYFVDLDRIVEQCSRRLKAGPQITQDITIVLTQSWFRALYSMGLSDR